MAMRFEGMHYNIDAIPETEMVVSHFADLAAQANVFMRESDLPEGVSADKVLRYLIYMYSIGSPLRTDITDHNKRKQYALSKINVVPDATGEIPDGYSQMCMMNEDWIVDRFIALTKFFRSLAWEKLIVTEVRISQLNSLLLSTSIEKSNADKDLHEGRKRWYGDMKDALEEIMDGEKSVKLQEEIVFRVKMENIGIRPEEYSRFYADKGTVFPEIIP